MCWDGQAPVGEVQPCEYHARQFDQTALDRAHAGRAADTLDGEGGADELIAAVEQADEECGSCGCEYDALYKRFLALKSAL